MADLPSTVRKTAARILIVDDEESIGKSLRSGLVNAGFIVEWEGQAQRGIQRITTWHPDVIILDYHMPGMNGLEFCQRVRVWSMVPIIMLSVHDTDVTKSTLLEAGADDYLTKPFSMLELIARIHVALRHMAQVAGGQANASHVTFGTVTIDFNTHQVYLSDREVHLTPTEFAVLKYLALHIGRVVTYQRLLSAVWGPEYAEEVQYLRVCVAQLRAKLEPVPSRARYLVTVSGVGYRLKAEDSASLP